MTYKPDHIGDYRVWPDGKSEREERWVTTNSHPYSGLQYQEWEGKARVIRGDREIVSPSADTDSVYAQYQGKVQHAIGE
jgi:hypothetical protein